MAKPFEATTHFQRIATEKNPFVFADGKSLSDLTLAYETYGRLNEKRDNAILLFHALSGSQHAAGINRVGPGNQFWTEECFEGWWSAFIGPGRALNTRRFFVICVNYVGGCYGSSGPSTINPESKKPYGASFPWPSISNIVDSQLRLLDHLGIETLLGVVGASMGGFCALDLAVRFPERVRCVVPVATGTKATVLAKALNFEQIFAIEQDQDFRGGDYYEGRPPNSGLTLARMISHKTFVSLKLMESRAKKAIIQPEDVLSNYQLRHSVESYVLHQGRKFVRRFDANSYLRIINAWQQFDLPGDHGDGDLTKTLRRCRRHEWVIFSINSDACFYPEEQVELANALKAIEADYQHITVHSEKGHDSFLLEPDLYSPYISFKLSTVHELINNDQ